jgi:hypothetical protein
VTSALAIGRAFASRTVPLIVMSVTAPAGNAVIIEARSARIANRFLVIVLSGRVGRITMNGGAARSPNNRT